MDRHQSDDFVQYSKTLLKIMGVGFVAIVAYINIDGYFTSKEFPLLSLSDSIDNQRVSVISKKNGAVYVEFENGKKNVLVGSQNLNYVDFISIVSVLNTGDHLSKKANSDTIKIKHDGKEYLYLLNRSIQRSK